MNNKKHIPINKWIEEERPREMLFKKGAENLSLASLLAIIIRTGTKGKSAQDIALELLNRFGSLREIDKMSFKELAEIKGIGFSKAAQIKAAFELGKRFLNEQSRNIKKIKSPDDAVEYIFETQGIYLRDKDNEYFYVLFLNTKNAPIDMIMISKGSSNATVVDAKEIVKHASLKNASGVILIHNHPSGDTMPSKNDIELTKKIKSALELVNVKVIDHIIIGKDKHECFSFTENGII
ncbi:MAG: DNA repair protein RadC [Elusimicrobiales bacterium]|nr:DNA repair protein RadC [Elusimicrobiales bacterium]